MTIKWQHMACLQILILSAMFFWLTKLPNCNEIQLFVSTHTVRGIVGGDITLPVVTESQLKWWLLVCLPEVLALACYEEGNMKTFKNILESQLPLVCMSLIYICSFDFIL